MAPSISTRGRVISAIVITHVLIVVLSRVSVMYAGSSCSSSRCVDSSLMTDDLGGFGTTL